MSIFDKVKKGMLDGTKTIKEISTEMTEMTRLKVSLSKEKAQLEELYYDLGKILYASYEKDKDIKDIPEVVLKALTNIRQTHLRIAEYEHRIEFLKGILKCNQCGNEVNEEDKFCSNCGGKLTFSIDKSPIDKEANDISDINDEVLEEIVENEVNKKDEPEV